MQNTGFKIVSRYDPAIDVAAMTEDGSIRIYRENGDAKHLKILPGATPTWFYCRRLKTSEMQAVRAHASEADILVACFARGVERVTGLRVETDEETDDPPRRDWVRPDPTRPLTTAEIDTFDPGDVFEIGSAIYGRSILGKGRPAAWPQPDTSRLAVQGLVVRHAARTPKTDASSPQSKSGLEEPPPTTSGG